MTERIIECPVCGNLVFTDFLNIKDYFLTRREFTVQQCETCRFKFVNPRPGMDEIGGYYESDNYISHDARSENLISRIYKIARVVSIKGKYKIVSDLVKDGNILDIGCGTGEFLRHCKLKGYRVTGVEPNEKASRFAKETNEIPVTGMLSDLAEKKGDFNCITLWHVLEHLHDLNGTMNLLRTLLNPGGYLIIAVPNSDSWDAQKYGQYWAAYDVPRHLYNFNAATMKRLVNHHGFELLKVIPQKLDAYYVSMLSEKYRSGRNNYVKAFFTGLWSNVQAGKGGRGHSSQIFILSAKKR